uniref:AAA+ ATPase domain-containing protein n=1 Tax=Picea sitchensis TaxID=3332 RepID=D5A9D7_PICSI|nr:unknown [Picea sitchensis]
MEVWSNLGSIMAAVIFIRTMAKEYLPPEFYGFLSKSLRSLIGIVSSHISVVIEENDGMKVSEVYEAVQTYLSVRSCSAAKRLKLKKPQHNKEFTFSMARNEQIAEEYEGIKVWWVFHSSERKQQIMFSWNSTSEEKRYYKLTFHKKHKHIIFDQYLPHVMAEAKTLEIRSRYRKIYTNQSNSRDYEYRNRVWTPVVFDHPATFGTLALEPELKQDIMEDLQRFLRGEKYYRQVGRAWKRGYLLYGPPGTGKSSMIAAMANFLDYDIYDLELTQVKNNTELRKLLFTTTNKSIIVIEDIDCSLDLSDRKKKKKPQKDGEEDEKPSKPGKPDERESNEDSKVTLSGVLNFTDGLWSCCGSERLFVFTTNHVDRLDPALLRSGRMDKHILLTFCTFGAFKILARNYLSIEDHELFPDIGDLTEAAQMTPADVTEHLMKMADHPSRALENLIQALREAKERIATAALKGISEENASATEGQV